MRFDPDLGRFVVPPPSRRAMRFPFVAGGRPDLVRLVTIVGLVAAAAAIALVPGRLLLAMVVR